jgi:Cullin family/Cullin protein neddylation domain
MCIELFRDKIYHHRDLKQRIIEGTCGMLAVDRGQQRSATFDSELFRHVIAMFHAMTVYTLEIESKILGASQSFFVDWVDEHSDASDLKTFLGWSRQLKATELERCDKFSLSDSTKRELVQQIDKYLIENQARRLTRTPDVAELIADNDVDTLAALFGWLQVKQLGERLKYPVAEYIDAEGTQIIFDEKRENDMVVRLLLLKKQIDTIHERAFAKNQGLGHAMREAFGEFMNKNKRDEATGGAGNDKPGEMIAKYVDVILKGGTKAIPQAPDDRAAVEDDMQRQDDERDEDEVINKELDRVLDLFRFVQGKATFEAFYKKDLAKRLLMNRSASADAEKSMLTRLRQNCGSSFTHNLEQMFKDIGRSREENAAYKSLLEDRNAKPAFDLSVNTLSAAAWPSYPDHEVAIPADIQIATSAFETHYTSKYVGRKLEWKHGLAHCQMRARFPSGQKELILSSFQAIVLLQFNDRPDNAPVPYTELQEATNLSDPELQRTLQSLACAKYRVLTKSPKGKEVDLTDQFTVNLNFKHDRARIKINQIQLKETPEEQKQTHERVATDRQFETQAAIVRILKAKKKIKHVLLVAEVITALKSRGAINAEDIKKQIEK